MLLVVVAVLVLQLPRCSSGADVMQNVVLLWRQVLVRECVLRLLQAVLLQGSCGK